LVFKIIIRVLREFGKAAGRPAGGPGCALRAPEMEADSRWGLYTVDYITQLNRRERPRSFANARGSAGDSARINITLPHRILRAVDARARTQVESRSGLSRWRRVGCDASAASILLFDSVFCFRANGLSTIRALFQNMMAAMTRIEVCAHPTTRTGN